MSGFGSGGFGGFGSGTLAPTAHGSGGVTGFFRNLGHDVVGAAEGFIPGTVHMVEHPIGSTETMGKAIWSTWSPLIHGQFTKFGQGVYEHPLAPLLDVASLASFGLGTAARLGTIGDAMSADAAALDAAGVSRTGEILKSALSRKHVPVGGQLQKDMQVLSQSYKPAELQTGPAELGKANSILHAAARLKLPKGRILSETNPERLAAGTGRRDVMTHFSEQPMRRFFQEVVKPGAVSKLPVRWQNALGHLTYTRALMGDAARRVVYTEAAKGAHIAASALAGEHLAKLEAAAAAQAGHMPALDATMLAGQALSSEASGLAAKVRTHLAVKLHTNLIRNAPYRAANEEQAVQFLMRDHNWAPVAAVPRGSSEKLLTTLRNREAKAVARLGKYAELAHSLPGIQQQLEYHNQQLQDMYDKGWMHTSTPANSRLGTPTVRQSMEQHAQEVLTQERIVKALESRLNKAHKAKAAYDTANQLAGDLKRQRMNAELSAFNEAYVNAGASHEAFQSFVNGFGRRGVVGYKRGDEASIRAALKRAAVGLDGSIPLVPRGDAAMLGRELGNSTSFARTLFRKATGFWKGIQIKWSAKTIANNTVANHIISMFRHADPLTAMSSMYHAIRLAHGAEKADQALARIYPWRNKDWLMKHFQVALHNNFLQGVEGDLAVGKTRQTMSRLNRVLKGPGAYALVTKVADEPVRLGAIVAYVRHHPIVVHEANRLMAEAKAAGKSLSRSDALDRAARRVLPKHPEIRDAASAYARTIAGDYLATTPRERALKDWVPFYLWDRHIAKSAGNVALDTPVRAALIQQLSQEGTAQAQKILGTIPEFLKGALPLQMLGLPGTTPGGRVNALVAPSLNPWGTIGEFAGGLQQMVAGGDPNAAYDVLGQINPLLVDALSAGSGTNIMSGTPLNEGHGAISALLGNVAGAFPQVKAVTSALSPPVTQTASGNPKLYAQNELAAITNLLGVPIKQISQQDAAKLAKQEQAKISGKKKKNPFGGF